MAYVGNVPAVAYTNTVKDTFSGNGSTVAFTLSKPSTTNNVRVVVENVIQDPTVAYGVSGTTLTFTSAPPSGTNNIYVVHLGPAVQTVQPPTELSGNFTLSGALTVDNAGATVLTVDRATSDGTIIDLQKDGSSVGGIGVDYSTRMYIGTGTAGVFFNSDVPAIQPYSITSADVVDNSIDLGGSAVRFKNLYLSGGVYLGGTGSANLLDDYEEGTFTATLGASASRTGTWTSAIGRYIKVGVKVNVQIDITGSGMYFVNTNGYQEIGGIPFTASQPSGSKTYAGSWSGDSVALASGGAVYLNGSTIYIHNSNPNQGTSGVGGIGVNITYYTT